LTSVADLRLLGAFAEVFRNGPYIHRNQTLGNFIANHLFDDLCLLARSSKLVAGVREGRYVVNRANVVRGRRGRRGDGTFGELIPGEQGEPENGFLVKRGPVATVMVGAETKILAKSMIKQIDRVITDLRNQATVFRSQTAKAIAVGIVGVNHAEEYTSYEGDRSYPADPRPAKEAAEAIRRLESGAAKSFDEFIVLRFKATNVSPYPFTWIDERDTRQSYGAALLRLSQLIESSL
jgi:hypothetical protein